MSNGDFRRIAEAMPCGVEELDLEGRVLYANPARHRALGLAPGERTGQLAWELTQHHNNEEPFRRFLSDLAAGRLHAMSGSRSTGAVSGGPHAESVAWVCRRDERGAATGFVAVWQEPAAIGVVEGSVRDCERDLEQARALAEGIAHDLKNLLGVIIGNAEAALREHAETGGGARHNLEQVLEACARARALARHIEGLGRREGAGEKTIVSMGALLRSVLRKPGESPVDASRLRLRRETASDEVIARPERLRRLFEGVLLRAERLLGGDAWLLDVTLGETVIDGKRAMGRWLLAPGPCLVVRLRIEAPQAGPLLSSAVLTPYGAVWRHGSGSGLPLAMVPQTGPVDRIPDSEEAARTLREMATADEIVVEHEGALALEKQPDGVDLVLFLPRGACATSPGAGLRRNGEFAGSPGVPLLLVCADEMTRRGFAAKLGMAGYEVDVQARGQAALALVQAAPERFGVVVAEQALPDMKGTRLAMDLLRIRPDLLVILLAEPASEPAPEEARAAGVARVFVKPFTWRQVDLAVRQARAAT